MDTDILVELFEPDADAEHLDALARGLREELLELDVDDVEPASAGPAPEGTRGLELAAIGALLVKSQASVELVTKVVGVVRRWLRASPAPSGRTLRLTVNGQSIELTRATEAQQQQLVEEFIKSAQAG